MTATVCMLCTSEVYGCVTHIVAWCIRLHGVLGRQSDAAHSDDQQDAHLKVAQIDHVVTEPPHAGT